MGRRNVGPIVLNLRKLTKGTDEKTILSRQSEQHMATNLGLVNDDNVERHVVLTWITVLDDFFQALVATTLVCVRGALVIFDCK